MHRLLIGSAIAAMVTLLAPSSALAAKQHCALPTGAKKLASSDRVITYRTARSHRKRYSACYVPTGRRTLVATTGAKLTASLDSTAGRFVASQATDLAYDRDGGAFAFIDVLDAKTGKRKQISAYPGQRGSNRNVLSVSKVQVLEDGRAAWIARAASWEDQPYLVLTAALHSNKYGVFDTGPDIDPASLALTNRLAYWMRGGSAFGRSLADIPVFGPSANE